MRRRGAMPADHVLRRKWSTSRCSGPACCPVNRMGRSISLALLLLCAATSALAQGSSATLSGVVRDESGAVVPGVSVVVRSRTTGSERKTLADQGGRFSVPFLVPGHYAVRADLAGFAPADISDVLLNVNDEIVIELQ